MQPHNGCGLKVDVTTLVKEPPFQISWIRPCYRIEMVEIMDGRVGKHSVEHVRYVINNLFHLVIVKYGVISLVLCISTRLRLVTILTLLVKYLVIFHADLCNKSYLLASKRSERDTLRSVQSRISIYVYTRIVNV